MNVLDVCILVLVLIFAIRGWKKGFFTRLLKLLSWVIAIVGAVILYSPEISFVESYLQLSAGMYERTRLGIILVIVTIIIIRLLCSSMIPIMGRRREEGAVKKADRLLGAAFGIAESILVVSVLLLIAVPVMSLDGSGAFANYLSDSTIAGQLYLNNPLKILLGV